VTGTYRISASGKRSAYILILGCLAMEVFALWTLRSLIDGGLDVLEWPPAVILAVLALATPVLAWSIVEEIGASLGLDDDGLVYRFGRLVVRCPWAGVEALKESEKPKKEDQPVGARVVMRPGSMEVEGNSLSRLLHRQAHGRNSLTIYASLQNRDEIMDRIRQSLPSTSPAASQNETPESIGQLP
jgi:hypothetical protein